MIRKRNLPWERKLYLRRGLAQEHGIVGWLLILIILVVIFAIWLVVQLLQAIF